MPSVMLPSYETEEITNELQQIIPETEEASSYGLHIKKSLNDLEYWIKDEDYQYDFKNENNSLRIIQTYVDPYTEELESTSFLIADHAVLRLRAKIKQYLEESNACPDCSSCTHSKACGIESQMWFRKFHYHGIGQHNNNNDKEILSNKLTSGPAFFRPSIRALKQEDFLQGSSISFLSRPYYNCGIELRVVKVCLNAEPFYAVEFKAIENPEQNFKITLELANELCNLIEHIYIPFWSLSFKPRQGPDKKVYRISKKFGGNREFIFDFKHQENSYCLRITEHNTNNKKVKTARSINIPANFLKELQKELREKLKLAVRGVLESCVPLLQQHQFS
uniref:Uncharacterized protein n=1 Tax=Ditylenchus dipsaci TaxID=166011 RepID=A0A915CYJ9_9BILA